MRNMNKMIVILGQTATGKSDFAVKVAKQIKGEIISADSRQVYTGMNLGTGKITKREMQSIKHYLLDVVSPSKVFSVNDFQKRAFKKISEIIKEHKIPIVCGGTAFYIDALVEGAVFPEVKPDKKLREMLNKKTANELLKILKKLDERRAKNIDPKNKVRIIRAIEIAKKLGRVPLISKNNPYCKKVLKIGLTLPPEILKERIKARLLSRIKKGMIKEIKDLHEKERVSWRRLESFGLEYRYVSYFLQGKLNKNEMIEKLNTEIWHFAKRQKTWWKRDKKIIWMNPFKKEEEQKVLKEIEKFLK